MVSSTHSLADRFNTNEHSLKVEMAEVMKPHRRIEFVSPFCDLFATIFNHVKYHNFLVPT